MKKILSTILAAAMLLTFTACGDSTGESKGSSTETSADASSNAPSSEPANSADDNSAGAGDASSAPESEVNDKPTLSDDATYNAMVERSLMTTGDMTRMANVLKKAENGEEITVAYIGGSITEGLTVAPSEPELCWAYLSHKWLCEKYPDTKINYVNAGLSGTPSILGNVRLERDVLAHNPDIVFVEFAVNDGMEPQYRNSFESLVRTLLTNEKDIAVVLLFTVIENGHTCQPHMSEIGNNYNLPMISEPDSLGVEFSAGRMTWQEYSDDQSHPNVRGHKIVRDFVANYFEKVMEKVDENTGTVDKTLPEAKYSDRFVDMHFIDSEKLQPELVGFEKDAAHSWFQNSWSYFDSTGASFKFKVNCKSLEMVLKTNKSKAYADAEVYIDGELSTTVSGYTKDGWENPITALLLDDDEAAEHTVEIKIADGNKRYFAILGFGYCD